VKVSEVEPFKGTLAAPKALIITGGTITVTVAFETVPGPLSVAVATTLLFLMPPDVPVTFAEYVHELFGASVLPESESAEAPETAVAVPPQVVVNPLGVATTNPAGKLSAKPTPVNAMEFPAGLLIVNVKLVEPFKGIVDAPKALTIVGGVATLILAVAVLPVPPLVEETDPVVFTN
jgi:hypothetical protein